MKKIAIYCLSILLVLSAGAIKSEAQVQTRDNYAAYLGSLDTLTNADTTTYIVAVSGNKAHFAVQADVLKISGTVNAKMYAYGSINGTTYLTSPIDSISLSDASRNYKMVLTSVPYQKIKLQWLSTATQSFSQRTYLLYRKP